MAETGPSVFSEVELHSFCSDVFTMLGVPEEDALTAASVLVLSDLRGIDSHGVARLPAYVQMLQAGRINPRPNVHTIRETPSTATVDGDNGLGLVVGPQANRIAMEKAEQAGSGWVTVRNSNHYGIAGGYVMEAAERGLIGWSMTNTTRMAAPLFGAERMLGTNPIAVAFPAGEEPPVVIDMATTAAAFGKVEMARRKGEQIPPGWALGGDGLGTTDPVEMMASGALLPLGSTRELGGHKGYALAAMVDLLCGPLAGANWGPFTPAFTLQYADPTRSVGEGLGHLFGALQVEAFLDRDEFGRQVDDWIRTMRGTRPAPGTSGPLIPGDPERLAEADRRQNGIPLIGPVVQELEEVARQTGISLG